MPSTSRESVRSFLAAGASFDEDYLERAVRKFYACHLHESPVAGGFGCRPRPPQSGNLPRLAEETALALSRHRTRGAFRNYLGLRRERDESWSAIQQSAKGKIRSSVACYCERTRASTMRPWRVDLTRARGARVVVMDDDRRSTRLPAIPGLCCPNLDHRGYRRSATRSTATGSTHSGKRPAAS